MKNNRAGVQSEGAIRGQVEALKDNQGRLP